VKEVSLYWTVKRPYFQLSEPYKGLNDFTHKCVSVRRSACGLTRISCAAETGSEGKGGGGCEGMIFCRSVDKPSRSKISRVSNGIVGKQWNV
jgi:hypothetical protein